MAEEKLTYNHDQPNQLSEIQELSDRFNKLDFKERVMFVKNIQILDGRNIHIGGLTGTRIGESDTSKLGFYSATPIVRQSAITKPSGGVTVDASARSAINDIIDKLKAIGITL